MCTVVHHTSAGCPGPLTNAQITNPAWHQNTLTAECERCGAVFGKMPLDKPPTQAYTLGVLLAGGGFEDFLYQMEMSDCQSPSITTLNCHLPGILRAVDEVYDELMAEHREAIKNEEGHKLVRIEPEKPYFLKNRSELHDVIEPGFAVKVTARYRATRCWPSDCCHYVTAFLCVPM